MNDPHLTELEPALQELDAALRQLGRTAGSSWLVLRVEADLAARQQARAWLAARRPRLGATVSSLGLKQSSVAAALALLGALCGWGALLALQGAFHLDGAVVLPGAVVAGAVAALGALRWPALLSNFTC